MRIADKPDRFWKPVRFFEENHYLSSTTSLAITREVEQDPNAYQYERAERFGVSQRTIGYALKRLGSRRKKHLLTSASRTAIKLSSNSPPLTKGEGNRLT